MSQSTASGSGDVLRTVLLVILILIAIPSVMMVVMMPIMGVWGFDHIGGWTLDGTGGTWAWILMWLMMLAILVGGGYALYREFATGSTDGSEPALDELRMAYARGALSDEEFETRRDKLRRDN